MSTSRRRTKFKPDASHDIPAEPFGNALHGLTPSAAISEGGLLAGSFSGPSWNRWRSVLKAAAGELLSPDEEILFREIAGDRDPPTKQVSELWCVCGRRAGKDSIASAIATVAALNDYTAYLRPGERASILCLASDRAQAKIIFRYIRGYFTSIPELRPLLLRETEDVLELSTGVEIIVSTSSYKAVRGRATCCAILDEVSFFHGGDESINNSEAVYDALLPSLATIPSAMIVGISSPHRQAGILYSRWKDAFGKNDPDTLVIQGATRQFNPLIPQRIVDRALEQDEEVARAEYLGFWRTDLVGYVDRAVCNAATMQGVTVIPPIPGVEYRAFVDCAGGSGGGDSYCLGIGFMQDSICTLARIEEWKPPFSPQQVTEQVCEILREYNISSVTGDRWSSGFSVDAFSREGVQLIQNAVPKSQIYGAFLTLLNSGKVQLLDNPRLVSQMCSLERRVSRSGNSRDIIDHPVNGNDDLANVSAGVLTLLDQDRRPLLLDQRNSRNADTGGVPIPEVCDGLYAVLTTFAGNAATCYFSRGVAENLITLLDFDAGPISGQTLPSILDTLASLSEKVRVRYTTTLFVPSDLVRTCNEIGYPAQPIPDKLIQTIDTITLTCATKFSQGQVVLSDFATEKSRHHPLGASIGLRAGDDILNSPLRLSFILGVALGLIRSH